MTTDSTGDFQARARFEAARYGADGWVFVRELLQNSRDADAGRVRIEASSSGGLDRIACRDDGCGMTFSHARDFLFTLYASSKKGGPRSAGRFGIGFWSILRFAPTDVTIRSRPRDGDGWQVHLDGDLNVVDRRPISMEPGTEIVIEREATGDDVENLVEAAVLEGAPFVSCRTDPDRPVDVRLNGKRIRATFDLPPPSLRFRRRGLRGVVGLGRDPKVEVFAHGLRVRDAASLDDLLLTGRRGKKAVSSAVGGFAPRALLDSSRLTVLLARGDAREDRALRRLVAVGHHEIRRLVRAELDRHTRPSRTARVVERARELGSARPLLTAGAVVLVVLGAFVGWKIGFGGSVRLSDPSAARAAEPAWSTADESLRPYTDLRSSYRGPVADVIPSSSPAVDFEYRPIDERPHFAALLIVGIDEAGAPVYPSSAARDAPCFGGCLEVELTVGSGAGVLALPMGTGYAVDADSVRWNGEPLAVSTAVGGLPAVDLGDRRGGRLIYRIGPDNGGTAGGGGAWPPLPPEMSGVRAEIGLLSPDARAGAAADWVRRRVIYDASAETARRHRAEQRRGRGLFERSLKVGAGDCDIQNALVAAILDDAGVPSRLAVGWVGEAGRARPGLHAWVEYLGTDGRWRVVDASTAVEAVPPDNAPRQDAEVVGARDARFLQKMLGAALVALVVAAALWLRRGRAQRRFTPGDRNSMADLVRAAAVQPESFAGVHALYHRKLVPLLGGRSISMARALADAGRGRLAVGGGESGLALRAAAGGAVVNGDLPVGAAAAEALGAVDLDAWNRLLTRSWDDPVATRVAELLTAAGEPFRLQIARKVGEDVAILDGAQIGLPAGERRMVFDAASEIWRTTYELSRRFPAAAALFLAHSVVDRLRLPPNTVGPCLAGLARAALDERAGGRS